jgi:hypothetical protein
MHSLDIRRAAEAAAGDLEHCALAELCAVAVCPAYACRAEQVAVGIGDQAALRSGTGDKDFLDLVETAHLTFKGAADGEIAFGALNAEAKQRKMALRRAQYAEIREVDRTIQLDSLAILEEVMRHFFWKARILEGMGTEGDFNEVDKAWAETGRWAKEVAAFRHAKIQSIRLAGDPNTPVLPEHMTLDELRVSIMADIERLREMGVLNLPRLPQGVVANSNADLPMNGGSSDQAE